jgi:prophage antirepressor-like protein
MLDQNDSASSAPDTNLPMEFRFEDQTIRTIFPDGEPRFVATDVCEVLGIKNPRDAIEPLDDDEKGVAKIDTLGGPQEMNVVNEFGLYRLILRSNKPKAKSFQRWVIHEVLPAIRKTGRYDRGPSFETPRIHARQETADAALLACALMAIAAQWFNNLRLASKRNAGIVTLDEDDEAVQELAGLVLHGQQLASRLLRNAH